MVIDSMMDDPPSYMSWQEGQAYQSSPEFQNADFTVDAIVLGEGRRFPIRRSWCVPIVGSVPSICPRADPPADDAGRRFLQLLLPRIAERFCTEIDRRWSVGSLGRQAGEPGHALPVPSSCQSGECASSARRRNGKSRLESSNPLQFQVYQRIYLQYQPLRKYGETIEQLKNDKDFMQQVKDCRLKLDVRLLHRVLSFFEKRTRRAQQTR